MSKGDLHYKFSQMTGCHPNGDGLRVFQKALTDDQMREYADILFNEGYELDPKFINGVVATLKLTNGERMEAAVKVMENKFNGEEELS